MKNNSHKRKAIKKKRPHSKQLQAAYIEGIVIAHLKLANELLKEVRRIKEIYG